jgi:hypothetical protein
MNNEISEALTRFIATEDWLKHERTVTFQVLTEAVSRRMRR